MGSLSLPYKLFFLAVAGGSLLGCNGAPEDPLDQTAMGGAGAETSRPDYELGDCQSFEPIFATHVVNHEFGSGQDYGQEDFPRLVLGGPRGGGKTSGSLDVVSLGEGGFVELGFFDRVITNGPGADFIVFENPFHAGGEEGPLFAELARISVSEDGALWHTFPCESGPPASRGCAGQEPVVFNVQENEPSTLDPTTSGGDLFDLADLDLDEVRYVRISDLAGDGAVFDLDAIAVLHGRCED